MNPVKIQQPVCNAMHPPKDALEIRNTKYSNSLKLSSYTLKLRQTDRGRGEMWIWLQRHWKLLIDNSLEIVNCKLPIATNESQG